jgi:hypothetical protein
MMRLSADRRCEWVFDVCGLDQLVDCCHPVSNTLAIKVRSTKTRNQETEKRQTENEGWWHAFGAGVVDRGGNQDF